MTEAVDRLRFPLLPGANGYVYFIGHTEGDIVKIGRTIGTVIRRLDELRRMSPRPESLIVRAAIPADSKEDLFNSERALHELFAAERKHGEWFEHTTRLEVGIATAIACWGVPGKDGLPSGINEITQTHRDFEEAVSNWNDHVRTWYERWKHLTDGRLPALREHVPHSLPLAAPLPVQLRPKVPTWATAERPATATVQEIANVVRRNESDWLTLAQQGAA